MRAPASAACLKASLSKASPTPRERKDESTTTSSIQARSPVGRRKRTSTVMPANSPSRCAASSLVTGLAAISAISDAEGSEQEEDN